MAADQALERGHLPEVVDEAVDVDVGCLVHRRRPEHERRRVRAERRQRVRADDDPLAEPVLALGAEHHRAVVGGLDHDEAGAGVATRPGTRAGKRSVSWSRVSRVRSPAT